MRDEYGRIVDDGVTWEVRQPRGRPGPGFTGLYVPEHEQGIQPCRCQACSAERVRIKRALRLQGIEWPRCP